MKNDNDTDLRAIEELLFTKLQENGLAKEDASPDNTVRGVEEVASEGRGGFTHRDRSVLSDNSGGSPGQHTRYHLLWK